MNADPAPLLVVGFGQYGRSVLSLLEWKATRGFLSCAMSQELDVGMTRFPTHDLVLLVCDGDEPSAVERASTQASELRDGGNFVLAIIGVSRYADSRATVDNLAAKVNAHILMSSRKRLRYCAVVVTDIAGMLSNLQLTGVDLSDIRSVWNNRHPLLLGVGYGTRRNRAEVAARKAMQSIPDNGDWLSTATGMYVIVSGGRSMRLTETRDALNIVRGSVPDEHVFSYLGAYSDDTHGSRLRVTIVCGRKLEWPVTP